MSAVSGSLATAAIIAVAMTVPAACGQSSASDPKFDVISIKLNQAASARAMTSVDLNFLKSVASSSRNGKLRMENIASTPLSTLIQLAYNVADFQIQGLPAWGNSERYSIVANAAGNATFEQMLPMICSLLADRFQLVLHRETRELPIYQLTVANGGPKIVAAKEGSCIKLDPDHPPPMPAPGKTAYPDLRWRGATDHPERETL